MTNRLILLFALLGLALAAKFSVPLRKSGVEHILSQASTGQQGFHNTWNEYYLADITLGTPPQPLAVAIDTTYSDFWALDVNCTSQNCHIAADGHFKNTFNSSESSTFAAGFGQLLVKYGYESVSGVNAKDTFKVAGFSIEQQDFGRALELPNQFPMTPVEGVLGLGFPEEASQWTVSPMKNLLPLLDKPVITIWYQRVGNDTKQPAGRITYGGIDKACDTNINYLPLARPRQWGFNVDGFKFGSYKAANVAKGALSDSTSAFTGVPNEVLTHIVKLTKAVYNWDYKTYVVKCSLAQTGPDATFTIGGKPYTIKAQDYVFDFKLANNQCALGFYAYSNSFGETVWVLGEALMRNYCHVYDFGRGNVGLSKIIGN